MAMSGVSSASSIGATEGASMGTPVERAETEEAMFVNNSEEKQAQAKAKQKQQAARTALTNDIKNGKAIYNQTGPMGVIGEVMSGEKIDDEIIIDVPKGTKLKDVSAKYNLPKGALRMKKSNEAVPGDAGETVVNKGYVVIGADELSQGTGVSQDELKKMFPKNQVSKWYQFK